MKHHASKLLFKGIFNRVSAKILFRKFQSNKEFSVPEEEKMQMSLVHLHRNSQELLYSTLAL